MKTAIASSIVLIITALALVSPCYSTTTSQVGSTLYTLPNPITLVGLMKAGPQCGTTCQFVSSDFNLQSGSTINVVVIQGQTCMLIVVLDGGGGKMKVFPTSQFNPIAGSGQGSFVAPQSGPYEIDILNIGTTPQTVQAVTVTLT